MADLQQIEDSIVGLSLLDAAQLVKKLEERLGVSAAVAAPAAFAGGAATVMLALSYGARGIITRRKAALAKIAPHARQILGVGLVAAGAFIAFHVDHIAERWALENLPPWLSDLSVSI